MDLNKHRLNKLRELVDAMIQDGALMTNATTSDDLIAYMAHLDEVDKEQEAIQVELESKTPEIPTSIDEYIRKQGGMQIATPATPYVITNSAVEPKSPGAFWRGDEVKDNEDWGLVGGAPRMESAGVSNNGVPRRITRPVEHAMGVDPTDYHGYGPTSVFGTGGGASH